MSVSEQEAWQQVKFDNLQREKAQLLARVAELEKAVQKTVLAEAKRLATGDPYYEHHVLVMRAIKESAALLPSGEEG